MPSLKLSRLIPRERLTKKGCNLKVLKLSSIIANATYSEIQDLTSSKYGPYSCQCPELSRSLCLAQTKKALIEWIGSSEGFSKPLPQSVPGTGGWFLASEPYRVWCGDGPSVLWCHGAREWDGVAYRHRTDTI